MSVSPFPKGTAISWGRTDQGVDGTVRPGTPLLAIDAGTIEIAHDPGGFGASYPVLHTSQGSFYYGHSVPLVANGATVKAGQPIASAHFGTRGNSTQPGGFEIGSWPPGGMNAGGSIRAWLEGLPQVGGGKGGPGFMGFHLPGKGIDFFNFLPSINKIVPAAADIAKAMVSSIFGGLGLDGARILLYLVFVLGGAAIAALGLSRMVGVRAPSIGTLAKVAV